MRTCWIFIAVMVAGWATAASAQDLYLEETLETLAPMGQPTMNGTIKTWIKDEMMRKDSLGRDTVIFRPDKKVAWMIHEPSKSYIEVPIASLKEMTESTLALYRVSTDPTTGKPQPMFPENGSEPDGRSVVLRRGGTPSDAGPRPGRDQPVHPVRDDRGGDRPGRRRADHQNFIGW
ncbi:MAG: hypothetical protein M5R36_20825 [Deltaproteobacteria bacterium]|nr:hypothetical protein [Deltaproteobacteria bacterium]